jgi:hypothetical protein
MHGSSFPIHSSLHCSAHRCPVLLSPPEARLFVNWFDQSGMKAGLQQFPSCGKKPAHIGDISDYTVDFDAYY